MYVCMVMANEICKAVSFASIHGNPIINQNTNSMRAILFDLYIIPRESYTNLMGPCHISKTELKVYQYYL